MRRIMVGLIFSFLLAGCQISPRRGTISGGGGGGGGTGGQLYVSTANSILHFNQAETSNGNIAPVGTISGAGTQLSAPQHLFLDGPNDRLYVPNQGGSSILVFDSASTANGNVTPTRVIGGAATQLVAPIDVALDPTNNLLYVADGTSILVFSAASTVNGNTPPVRNINMGVSIGGLFLDAPNNQLYVSDPGDNAVDRLDGASAQDVVGVVGGAIAGANTGLSQPRGLALDGSGRLLVSNSASPASIVVFTAAGSATGNIAPSVTISGSSTLLRAPGQIALNRNVGNGELYVLDPLAASVFVFTNAPTTGGNVAPARTIAGSNTGITASAVNGLAIDPTR
jgi:6-phosphogluconolactonase (cycloisomerase 2 family)